jgi:tetratricopeptide (TPR) repeat protein
MEDRPKIEDIDRYIKGEMSQQEQQAFLSACEADPELKRQLHLELKAKASIHLHGRQAHKNELKAWYQAENPQQGKVRSISPTSWAMAIAAGLLLLLAVGWLLQRPAAPVEAQSLFASVYERPRVPEKLNPADTLDQIQRLRAEARNQYFEGAHSAAADAFEQLSREEEGLARSQAFLYLGICRLELEQYEQARQALQQAEELQEQAEWYTALSYLKEGKLRESREALQTIVAYDQHFYKTQAKDLLEKIGA